MEYLNNQNWYKSYDKGMSKITSECLYEDVHENK